MTLRIQSTLAIGVVCFAIAWGTFQLTASPAPQSKPQTSSQTSPQDEDIRLFMRAKLTSSQKLLEGLVVEDFAKIQKGASEMRLLSKGATWPQADDKIYNHFSTTFQMHCEKIEEMAKQKNLEGVKFTYLQLTTSCVDCHSYVRGRFKIKKRVNKKGPVQLIPTYWDDK